MTKLLFTCMLLLGMAKANKLVAQDVIHKVNGEVIEVQIIATSKTDITYMTKNKQNADTIISIERSEVVSFKKASENMELAKAKVYTAEDSAAIYEEGKMDADIYYTRYKRPGTLVLVTSLISPLVGLVPAIISTATPVKDQNKWYPPSKEPKLDLYYKGYAAQANKKKHKVVWRNWTIGLATNLLLVILFLPKA